MNQMRTYSTEGQLKELAYSVLFPVHGDDMLAAAESLGCSPAVLSTLAQFDPDDVFENGVDFINRCDELQLLAREACDAPKELLRNPQC